MSLADGFVRDEPVGTAARRTHLGFVCSVEGMKGRKNGAELTPLLR